MKKYVFTVQKFAVLPSQVETVVIVAKNIQSAVAKLCQGGFYSEDKIIKIEISTS